MDELGAPVCAAHGVVTRLECVSCGVPICLRCQVPTPDGLACVTCAARDAAPVDPPDEPVPAVGRVWGRRPPAIVALVLGVLLLGSSIAVLRAATSSGRAPSATPSGHWEPAPDLTALRGAARAVVLADGRVLAVGGGIGAIPLAGAEIYDPGPGRWSRTADLHQARRGHAAVVLPDGRVLVVGGVAGDQVLSSAELYQPSTGTWADAPAMHDARLTPTLTLLADGRVLAAGGVGPDGRSLRSAELFDPGASSWTAVGTGMTAARSGAAAIGLRDGRVLIAGGTDGAEGGAAVLASSELFDPVGDVFVRTGDLRSGREGMTATLLVDGRVLVAGGSSAGNSEPGAEVFDPARGSWTTTGSMAAPRRLHGASLLADGTVLVSGGEDVRGGARTSLVTAEVFDPRAGRWHPAAAMSCPRRDAAQVSLHDGTVLVVGGDTAGPAQPSAAQSCVERFVPDQRARG
jgi:hypothetical protein